MGAVPSAIGRPLHPCDDLFRGMLRCTIISFILVRITSALALTGGLSLENLLLTERRVLDSVQKQVL